MAPQASIKPTAKNLPDKKTMRAVRSYIKGKISVHATEIIAFITELNGKDMKK